MQVSPKGGDGALSWPRTHMNYRQTARCCLVRVLVTVRPRRALESLLFVLRGGAHAAGVPLALGAHGAHELSREKRSGQ